MSGDTDRAAACDNPRHATMCRHLLRSRPGDTDRAVEAGLRSALERLVAVVDAASIIWRDPVPADAIEAIHNAKSTLAALSGSPRSDTALDVAWKAAETGLRSALKALEEEREDSLDSGWTQIPKATMNMVIDLIEDALDVDVLASKTPEPQ